jgi:16S rRNA (cytidine1402-2'-O)-methyltransferase
MSAPSTGSIGTGGAGTSVDAGAGAASGACAGAGTAVGAGIAVGGAGAVDAEGGVASDGLGTCGAIGRPALVAGDCAAQNALAATNATAIAQRSVRIRSERRAGDESVKDTKETAALGARGPLQDMPAGSLYVVATPLGNLDDVTIRARDTLSRVDRIYAEDTRVTATLLSRLGIARRATALHAHNEAARVDAVLAALAAGERIGLVSDAGTPAISDPGARLVRAVHEAGHRVVPVPGPSAVAAAVSAAGLAAEQFVFVGFLPAQAKARRELFASLGALPVALAFYEAPHRVRETVAAIAEALDGDRMLVIAREITKQFEQIVRMPLSRGAAWLDEDANHVRGEFVLVVDAPPAASAVAQLTPDVERWLAALLDELPPAAASRVVARVSGVPRDDVYQRAMALK